MARTWHCENLHGRVRLWGCIFFSSVAWWGAKGAMTVQDEFNISSDTNVTVAAGDTLHIEYLYGSTSRQLTKLGGGRLEIAVFGVENVHVAVSNGTFAVVRPQTMDLSGDENVVLHVDATATSSMTLENINGTNYVTEWRDVDGKTAIKAVQHTTRPRPYITTNAINGLQVVDFGTLQNTGGNGYGASMLWEYDDSNKRDKHHEWLFSFEDDPNAKNYTKPSSNRGGPSIFGQNDTTLQRDWCGDGYTASILYSNAWGRIQGNNYLDGNYIFHYYKVPDGPHTYWFRTNTKANYIDGTQGFGFTTSKSSYGGFKLGEFIVCDDYFDSARRTRVTQYLTTRWLGAKVKMVTLAAGTTFDTSQCRVKIENFDASRGSVTDWSQIETEFVHAGSGCRPMSGMSASLPDRSAGATWNLAFSGAAGLSSEAGTTGAVSRVEGVGTFTKTGSGTVLVGSLEGELNKVDVQAGTLRIAPLEAPGVALRLDASREDTLETEALNGTNFVSRWNDANGRLIAAATNGIATYTFDASRKVSRPFLMLDGPRGGMSVDFGTYATGDHPEGNGGILAVVPAFNSASLGNPGLQNFLVVWKDRDETSELSSDPYPTVGPSLFGNDHYWWRGFGGKGNAFPMHYGNAPTRMYGSLFIDGTARDWKKFLPPVGWHLLDQQLNWPAGAPISYIGGNTNTRSPDNSTYVGSTNSGDYSPHAKAGVYGGVCFSEIVMFQRALTPKYRKAAAGALGAKWFGNDNVLGFDSVTLADGTALEMPFTQVCVTNLSFSGASRMEGVLTLPAGAAVNVSRNAANGFATLSADGLVALGGGTVNLAVADLHGLLGRSFKLFDVMSVSGDFSKESWSVSGLEEFSITARLDVRDDGVWLDVANGGTCVIFR